ncbi:MAG: YncE family protein [Patescibacteria group bacterium]|jgi:YVTN family beta-propeller protein
MKKLYLMLAILGLFFLPAFVFAAPFAYIANSIDNTVSVIDEASSSVIKTIGVGTAPHGVAINPAGTKAYISNYESSNVSVIDVASQTLINNITVGTHPDYLASNSAGTRLYVGNRDSDNVYVIDMTSDAVISIISIGGEVGGIAISLDNSKAYVVDSTNDRVRIANLVNDANTITKDVSVGVDPLGAIISPIGDKVYISNTYGGAAGTVSVIDVATDTVSGSIAVGNNPIAMTINEDGSRLYVANFLSGSISVVDTSIRSVISTFTVGTMPMGIDLNSTEDGLLVVDYSADTVYQINSSTGVLSNSITVGNGPVSYYNFVTPTPAPTPTPEPTTVEIQQQNLVDGKRVKLKKALKKQTIEGQDLKLYFKKLPTKLTKGSKYYMKWKKTNKYPKGIEKVKKTAMKKVWKLNTNLKKYKAKVKKQNYTIKTTFTYTDAEFRKLKNANSNVRENELGLLVRKTTSNTWVPINDIWKNVTLKHNVEKNTFSFNITNSTELPVVPANLEFMIVETGFSSIIIDDSINVGPVRSMAVYHDKLYMAGTLLKSTRDDVYRTGMARYNGRNFTNIEGHLENVLDIDTSYIDLVFDNMVVYNNELYVSGTYYAGTHHNAELFNFIARWNGREWRTVGDRTNFGGKMAVYDGELYVTDTDRNQNYPIEKWDGHSWISLANEFPENISGFSTVSAMTVYNGELFFGGKFKDSNSEWHDLLKWNGRSYTFIDVGSEHYGEDVRYFKMLVFDNELYISTNVYFEEVNSSGDGLYKWNGESLSVVDLYNGADHVNGTYVNNIGIYNNELFMIGGFVENDFDFKAANWNGNSLTVLDLDLNSDTYDNLIDSDLIEYHNDLYGADESVLIKYHAQN